MIRTALALALLVTCARAEAATILAQCGPSTGQSYYFEAGMIGPGQGGWQKDGFDGGRVTAYVNDKDEVDILMRDATGVQSYLKQGYKVELVSLSLTERAFLITVYGSSFTETYLFKTNKFGVGTLAWTASKITSLVIRTSAMTAECGPRFAIEP